MTHAAKVDFVDAFAFGSSSVAQKTRDIQSFPASHVFFLAPFETPAWIAIAGLILAHIVATMVDKNFAPPEPEHSPAADASGFQRVRHVLLKTKLLRRMRLAFFWTAMSMVGHEVHDAHQPSVRRGPSTRQRLLLLFALLCGLFLTIVYEAGLVVQLFNDKPVSDFRSLEDITDCRLDARNICIPAGGAMEKFWNLTVEPARRRCNKNRSEDQPRRIRASTGSDPYSSVLEHAATSGACSYAFASTHTISARVASKFCNKLSIVGKQFYYVSSGFVLPKGSNLTTHMSAATLRLQQENRLPSAVEYATQSQARMCEGVKVTKISLRRLSAFFLVAFGTLLFITVYMLFDTGRPGERQAGEEAH